MNIKKLLKNRNYCLYWVASAICMAGSNIYQYLLSLYVLEITGSSTLFAGMLSIIIIPQVILMPFSGIFADRFRRIRMMSLIIFSEFILLAVFFAIGRIYGTMTLPMIYVLVVIMEVGEIFYEIPSSAIVPELVEPELIKSAVAVSRIDNAVVNVSGPMISALLYTHLNIYDALAVVALVYLVTFILQCCIHPAYELKDEERTARNSFLQDFKGGIKVIADDSFLKTFISIIPFMNAFFGAVFSVSIMFLFREVYGLSAYLYGLYCSISSCASLIVPFFAVPIVSKFPTKNIFRVATALIGTEVLAIALFTFLGTGGFIPVIASVILITIFDCMTISCAVPMQMSMQVIFQTQVPKDALGRVMSVVQMLTLPSLAIVQLIFGFMNDAFPVWVSVLIAAIGILVSSYIFSRAIKKDESADNTAGA